MQISTDTHFKAASDSSCTALNLKLQTTINLHQKTDKMQISINVIIKEYLHSNKKQLYILLKIITIARKSTMP